MLVGWLYFTCVCVNQVAIKDHLTICHIVYDYLKNKSIIIKRQTFILEILQYKLPPCMARNALGYEFGSAAQLSKRPGSVWSCLWGNTLKKSPRIIRKSRVLYPVPGFLSSATWLSLPKKHYNGLNQIKLKI